MHFLKEGEREGENGTMLLLDSNTGSHVKQLIESAFHRGRETSPIILDSGPRY